MPTSRQIFDRWVNFASTNVHFAHSLYALLLRSLRTPKFHLNYSRLSCSSHYYFISKNIYSIASIYAMAKTTSSGNSSNRERKWDKVFSALVKMLQNLQKERQFLKDGIKSLNGVIYQMKMEQYVESAKVDLLLGLKEREAFIYKNRHENADDELADFIEWFRYLSQKNSETNDPAVDATDKARGSRNKSLQDEVRKLKTELERIQLEKKSEVTALLDEKKFVWNQYSKMENDFTEKLKKKSNEVELANEKITVLVNRAEELQSSNERIKTDLAKMESDSFQKSNEISRLMKEIEILKSRSESETPVLRPCRKATRASQREGTNSSATNGRGKTVKKESDPSDTLERAAPKPSAHKSTGGKAPRKQLGIRESSSSKRRAVNVITIPDDTPKLFTSRFKVPKLKPSSSSPQVI